MFKFIFRLLLLVIVCLLGYYYFFGNKQEKENSRMVFNQAKALTASLVQFVKTEKVKFDEGKYDKALDKIGQIYDKLWQSGDELTTSEKEQLKKLEQEKQKLQKDVDANATKDQKEADESAKGLNTRLNELIRKTEELVK